MKYEELKTEYFTYLMRDRLGLDIDEHNPYGYKSLCEILHDYSFIPLLPFDENRCSDCVDLRHEFSDEYGDIISSILPATGTMLELMVVLVGKISYNTVGSIYQKSEGQWFEEMLKNADLNKWNNRLMTMVPEEFSKLNIYNRLETVIYRLFDWDGAGSFFPLRSPKNDQRHEEILVQMNNYIAENYDIS